MSTAHPPSTVAWSVYNALAVLIRRPCSPAGILAQLQQTWEPSLDLGDVRAACRELAARGVVVLLPAPTEVGEELVDLRDPQRRAVVSRDRDDPTGWCGWRVEARAGSVAEKIGGAIRAGGLLQEVIP